MPPAEKNPPRWIIGEDPYRDDDEIGYLLHNRPPRFVAGWSFGPPPADSGDIVFMDDDADDAVHLFALDWLDDQPDRETFNRLMSSAVEALDRWLERNSEPLEEHRH
ncbi:MAG: hypothetical protein ABW089_14870 [Sedimenticola sp.]